MQRRVAAFFVFAFVSAPLHVATAASLPEIRSSASNAVPECVTPGRLLEFLKSRNPDLSQRFDSVPSEYMRLGEQLGVRWDFAFYQMILETGALSYRRGNRSGDVRATQNNFAGLGATGGGAPGESFKDVPTGVRAHLDVVPTQNRLSAYRSITAPVLVIGFADDVVLPPHLSREVADAVPNGRYLEIPRTGHLGFIEKPQVVNPAVLEFFADRL